MPGDSSYDVVVVGSGPNGLAAAIRLAQEKLSVLVLEANATIGGSARSAELTLPGFTHDVCSAIHPLGVGSPFFRRLPLEKYGLHWIGSQNPPERAGSPPYPIPTCALAHPLEHGRVALLHHSLTETAAGFATDRDAWLRLMGPLVSNWQSLADEFLQPLLHLPRHPLLLGRFGLQALRSATAVAKSHFQAEPARALFGGLAAHSFLPLEAKGSAAFALVLGLLGHAVGWPFPRGGSQQITNALAAHLRDLGGEIATHSRIDHLDQLPLAHATLLDVTVRQFLKLAGDKLPLSYRRRLERFCYGPGVFKIDYALNGPIPWTSPDCSRAPTVHVGGSLEEISLCERSAFEGTTPEHPFVLLAQPSLFDHTRAPAGKHTAWVYCHVPNGSSFDMTERIEKQIERFAPGFRQVVLARHASTCAALESHNANLVGGDINGGAADLWQLLARPVFSPTPYRTPLPGVYLCSASTPPGGGVHGMCGLHAAEAALRDCF